MYITGIHYQNVKSAFHSIISNFMNDAPPTISLKQSKRHFWVLFQPSIRFIILIPERGLLFSYFNFKDLIYLSVERREEQEKGRETSTWEKNIHWLPVAHWHTLQLAAELATLGYMLLTATFHCAGWCSTNWDTPIRAFFLTLHLRIYIYRF